VDVALDPGGTGNASHDGIAHVAFDHKHSLRSREFIISWLNHTPHATAVYASLFGVAAALTQTRFQAACELSRPEAG